MKHQQLIEQQLIAAGQGRGTNEQFVTQTMQKLKAAAGSAAFSTALGSAKRPPLLRRLTHLPKLATLAVAFGACALLSGTAYAAYTFWLGPSAQVRSVQNKYGRDQALIDLKNCQPDSTSATVEITKGGTGTPDGAAKSKLAQCELQAIQAWAIRSLGLQASNVIFAPTVTGISHGAITAGLNGSDKPVTYTLGSDTPIVFQGKIVPAGQIHPGDTIAVIMGPDNHTVRAIIKLSLESKYYMSDEVNNDYHDRQPCIGNAPASCISLPNVDILRTGEGGANPGVRYEKGYEIQGKLVSYTPSAFVLEATDGQQYIVHTDSDVIGTFNSLDGNPYGSVSVEPGDVLMVLYGQPKNGNPKDIQSTQYHMIQLMLQGFSKKATDAENMQKYHY